MSPVPASSTQATTSSMTNNASDDVGSHSSDVGRRVPQRDRASSVATDVAQLRASGIAWNFVRARCASPSQGTRYSCERRDSRARRTEEERADKLFLRERLRSRRIQSARCASPSKRDEASAASVGRSRGTLFARGCASPSQGTWHSCERRESRARRAEEERADTLFVCERRRRRRIPAARSREQLQI